MFSIVKKSMEWGGQTLTLETGRIARQADGAVLATYGDTVVLCAVTAAREMKPDMDFFPLTVNYIEKFYSAGKIPGGFFKREGRPTEKETLTSRLIDRPIRPLFAEGFKNETQVVCQVLSHDLSTDPDIVAMIAASAALTISGIPFMGPIGGARVGYIDGNYVLNPRISELPDSDLDLVVAGTQSSVLMVESEASGLPEDIMLGAVSYGHKHMQPVIDMIISLAEDAAKEPWNVPGPAYPEDLPGKVKAAIESDLRAAYGETDKQTRVSKVNEVREKANEQFVNEEDGITKNIVGELFKKVEKDIVRGDILKSSKRIDGRAVADVRPIKSEVEVLPRAHGSALFTRGETQALVVATLGTTQDEQIIDALHGDFREHFMLHYNFPPYSVGEAYMLRPPGRREIGHGKLAWRSLRALLPSKEEFPYTIRLVSEITESNGSSSMATVCGSSLAMMDAGVPLKAPCAGIAMGLIKEGDDFTVLSDIMGDEDHLGDMDFKVAGTEAGITALQMDIKISGITEEIMKVALNQAKEGRLHILGEMAKAMDAPRGDLNKNAPRITTMTVPKDKIREVIGSGGSVIRELCETTNCKIDIDDEGVIKIAAVSGEDAENARKKINDIVAEPENGGLYEGKVVRIVEFGAFVNFMGSRDGLVHVSEISTERVENVEDLLSEGDMVKVKVLDIDPRGKVRLSMKCVDQETGEDLSEEMGYTPEMMKGPKRSGGGRRDDRRGGGRDRDRGDRGDRKRKQYS